MRLLFIFLLIIHGLIHLLGFVKAFGFLDVKQLTQPISKPMGLLWLTVAILFCLTTLTWVLKFDYWWCIAFIVIVLSQLLIITSWHDAKSGTVVNLIFLAVSIVGFATNNYHKYYVNDVKSNLKQANYFDTSNLTEADILELPQLIQKYLRYTDCIGKPKVNNFKVVFQGKIRKNERSEWMQFTSEQYNFMHTPTRLFFMKANMKHLPVAGYHCFINGKAFMDIRLLSLIKVQYLEGVEMNMAETVTFFNDMCCMAPATLIDKRIAWKDEDSTSIKATFTNNNITINATLYFNKEGALVNFRSDDRFDYEAKQKLPWLTPLSEYIVINSHKIPKHAETIYKYPTGDLIYGVFEAVNVEYNCK